MFILSTYCSSQSSHVQSVPSNRTVAHLKLQYNDVSVCLQFSPPEFDKNYKNQNLKRDQLSMEKFMIILFQRNIFHSKWKQWSATMSSADLPENAEKTKFIRKSSSSSKNWENLSVTESCSASSGGSEAGSISVSEARDLEATDPTLTGESEIHNKSCLAWPGLSCYVVE